VARAHALWFAKAGMLRLKCKALPKGANLFQQLRKKTMAIERTLSIIKPDAVAKNVIGQIYARFEAAGLKVVAARMAHLSRAEAERSTPCTRSVRSSRTWSTS
jgi:hypothetical protein